jgi:dihydroorotate dehydrogenase electron transfer subunit
MNNHRDTIALEQATIHEMEHYAGEQYRIRLHAPECASLARPGSFVHLQCHPLRPLRRPISIQRVSAAEGWVEILFKVVGEGTALLAQRKAGESLSLLGPIGNPFQPSPERPRPLLLGGGIGIPPLLFLAEWLHRQEGYHPVALFGSELHFPFELAPSRLPLPGCPAEATAALALLEGWRIPNRLASLKDYPGCFQGYVTQLAERWLEALTPDAREEVELFACGPHPMLEAVAKLAARFGLPCQVSLEEFMACGVGGCAGCTVPVETATGTAMKRVCVDGPIFDAYRVFPG